MDPKVFSMGLSMEAHLVAAKASVEELALKVAQGGDDAVLAMLDFLRELHITRCVRVDYKPSEGEPKWWEYWKKIIDEPLDGPEKN
jgi:hypothetical protein